MNHQIQLKEICALDSSLTEKLLSIWESSVRATHLFLSDGEIKKIKKYVSQALNGVEHLVTVNEQNPQAVRFYEHMGFEVYKRTACDEQGGPYPLLYMKLK